MLNPSPAFPVAISTTSETSEPKWESFKQIIGSYYLDENLKLEGSGGVIEKMAQDHNFRANKQQYERHFRKWKFRKNLCMEDWIAIAQILGKRKQDALESEVYISNQLIPEKRIKKELSRYKTEDMSTVSRDDIRHLPDHVRIASPGEGKTNQVAHNTIGLAAPTTSRNISSSYISLDGLSFIEFEKFVSEIGNCHSLLQSAYLNTNYMPSASPSKYGNMFPTSAHQLIMLHDMPQPFSNSSVPLINDPWIQTSLFDPHFQWQAHLGNMQTRNAIEAIKLASFLITNDLASTEALTEGIRHITVAAGLNLLHNFLLRAGVTADAFAEKLFPHAVKTENTTLVKYLLERGLDPNTHINHHRNLLLHDLAYKSWTPTPMTPLTYACQAGHLELVRALLEGGADVNKPVNGKAESEVGNTGYTTVLSSPLTLACRASQAKVWAAEDEPTNEMVRLLLRAGAVVNPFLDILPIAKCDLPLSEASIAGNAATVNLLLKHGADINRKDWRGETALSKFLRCLNSRASEAATRVGQVLIQAGADLQIPPAPARSYTEREMSPPETRTAIDYIASAGNAELLQLIWRKGYKASRRTLEHAVQSGNVSLVEWLLHHMDYVNTPEIHLAGYKLSKVFKRENLEMAKIFSDLKVTPQTEESMEVTIEHAAKMGQHHIVEHLLEFALQHHDDWDLSQIAKVAPAMLAGQYRIADYLLAFGGLVDNSAVAAAVSSGDQILVRRLLRMYEKKVTFSRQESPLEAAIKHGNLVVLKMVLESGIESDSPHLVQSVNYAIENKMFKIVQMLLDAGLDLCHLSRRVKLTPLAAAASRGDLDGIQFLLNAGASVEDKGALVMAKDIDTARVLLDAHSRVYGRNRQRYGYNRLEKAMRESDLDMVQMLLSYGISPTLFDAENALSLAIKHDNSENLDIVREILSTGIDVNSASSDYGSTAKTALICAISRKKSHAIQLLISSGANIHLPATRQTKRTPLQAACECGFIDAVMLLIDQGVDVNAPPADVGGATAFQLAAIGGHIGIASILLDHGADMNAPAAKLQGRTALEGAAEWGRFDMVKLLLNAGVCITGPGEKQYLRALKFASNKQHRVIEKLLRSVSATAQGLFP